MPKLKEITKEKKLIIFFGGNPIRSFLLQASPSFERRYPIIVNIFYTIIWWNIKFPHFYKKEAIKKHYKMFHYIRGS